MLYLDVTQSGLMGKELTSRLPAFSELVTWYGPYLGLVLSLVILILVMQYYWFNRNLKAKDKEILRLVDREQRLTERLMHVIDKKTNYKPTN